MLKIAMVDIKVNGNFVKVQHLDRSFIAGNSIMNIFIPAVSGC